MLLVEAAGRVVGVDDLAVQRVELGEVDAVAARGHVVQARRLAALEVACHAVDQVSVLAAGVEVPDRRDRHRNQWDDVGFANGLVQDAIKGWRNPSGDR